MDKFVDKAKGCIVGGAIGDALGYPVEFIGSFRGIQKQYGERGITEFDLKNGNFKTNTGKAVFSDDTQMTLYTAEGIAEAYINNTPLHSSILDAYLTWYGKQAGKNVKTSYESYLSTVEECNQNRAPGNTCMSALRAWQTGGKPENYSKGCGGVMRVAPAGIYGTVKGLSLKQTGELAGMIAEITHLHPLSTYSSAMIAIIIQQILTSEQTDKDAFKRIIEDSLQVIEDIYGKDAKRMDDFNAIINEAVSLENRPETDWSIIEGKNWEGWVAEEALAIAIFCVLRHFDSFTDCMIAAVNHGGDSDSTGAIAGNILGAVIGYKALPAKFTENLQLLDLILSVTDKLL